MIIDVETQNIKVIDYVVRVNDNFTWTINNFFALHNIVDQAVGFKYSSYCYDDLRKAKILHTDIFRTSNNFFNDRQNKNKYCISSDVTFFRKLASLTNIKLCRQGNEDFIVIPNSNDSILYKHIRYGSPYQIILYSPSKNTYYLILNDFDHFSSQELYSVSMSFNEVKKGFNKILEQIQQLSSSTDINRESIIKALIVSEILPDDIVQVCQTNISFISNKDTASLAKYIIDNQDKIVEAKDFYQYFESLLPNPSEDALESVKALFATNNISNIELGTNILLNYNIYSCIYNIADIFGSIRGSLINESVSSVGVKTLLAMLNTNSDIFLCDITEVIFKIRKLSTDFSDQIKIRDHIIQHINKTFDKSFARYRKILEEYNISISLTTTYNE